MADQFSIMTVSNLWFLLLACWIFHEECFDFVFNYISYTCTVISRYLEVDGSIFLQVQITRSANLFALLVIWTCKKVPNAKLVLEKAIKMYFWFRKTLRDWQNWRYRVRDIEIWLYYSFIATITCEEII